MGSVEACRRLGIGRKTGYRWRAEDAMDVDELLQHHGVDTAQLDPAPPSPSWKEMRDHLALLTGCAICGDTCLSAWVTDMGSGPRWVGLCRGHTPGVLSELAAPTVLGKTGAVHG